MHPLAKTLVYYRFEYSSQKDETLNRIIKDWAEGQAKILKLYFCKDMSKNLSQAIDEAFQIQSEICDKCGQDIK